MFSVSFSLSYLRFIVGDRQAKHPTFFLKKFSPSSRRKLLLTLNSSVDNVKSPNVGAV